MDKISFLFAPWGDPYNWRETEYVFKEDDLEISRKSNTTLPILIDALKPDHIFILALDTLAPYIKRLYKDVDIDYSKIIEYSREAVRNKLTEWDIKEDIRIEILPGIGSYKYRIDETWRKSYYLGMITDYKYTLSYFISRHFIDKLRGVDEDTLIQIYLDLTHGVNYMPTFTYDVLLSLSRILRYKFRKVSFIVYNSDPVIKGVDIPHNINKVVEVKNLAKEYMKEKMRIDNPGLFKFLDKRIIKDFKTLKIDKRLIEDLNMFIGGIINGLPLIILEYYPSIDKINNILTDIIMRYLRYTEVKANLDSLTVRHQIAFDKQLEILSKVMLISEIMNEYRAEPDEEGYYELGDLVKISNIYDSGDRNNYTVGKELYDIKESIKEFVTKSGLKSIDFKNKITLTRYYREYLFEDKYSINDKGRFIRNFLSHAGLEKNITLIKIILKSGEDVKIYLKYDLDKDIEINNRKIKIRELINEASTKELIEVKI